MKGEHLNELDGVLVMYTFAYFMHIYVSFRWVIVSMYTFDAYEILYVSFKRVHGAN